MPLKLAQRHAWNLARTLMVSVVLIAAGPAYQVMVASEYDGDEDCIVHEYDPFQP